MKSSSCFVFCPKHALINNVRLPWRGMSAFLLIKNRSSYLLSLWISLMDHKTFYQMVCENVETFLRIKDYPLAKLIKEINFIIEKVIVPLYLIRVLWRRIFFFTG